MSRNFEEIANERIMILDGAMGTMIQKYGLSENDYRGKRFADMPGQMKGNNDMLNITRPDVIDEIHRKYLEAGADIIETNTFSAQRVSMADYGLGDFCREINLEACRIARKAADEYTARTPEKPRFVAGSIGPTNKTCSLSPDVNDPALRDITYDSLMSAYEEQIEALLDGGVDALLIETIFDTLNAKAAINAAKRCMERTGRRVPLMLSATISDKAGRTLSGQTLEAFLASVGHADIFSVGLNCSFGAKQLKPFLKQLAEKAPYRISAYPNAGLPNSLGEYDQTPEDMAHEVSEYIEEGLVNIIGGCCGTTDEYIAQYASIIKDKDGNWIKPHVPVEKDNVLRLSGLELLEVTPEKNFINIGERCNVAGSRKFLRLINEKKYEEALDIARRQVEDGALILDINMDDGLLDAEHEMVNLLNLIMSDPEISRVPIMIDSSKWEVIRAGLKCVQGKCVVNSISLKEGEEAFIGHAREIKELGAATVVMAFDEKGQATTFERKIEICERAYKLLTEKVGFNPGDIIFDPNVLAVGTGIEEHNNYAIDFIKAAGWIRKNLPHAHISGGISNLSFAFRGNNYLREAMHAVFLYHAIQEGMDMGIVNPASKVAFSDIPEELLHAIEDVLFNRDEHATEKLLEMASTIHGTTEKHDESAQEDRHLTPVEERLQKALIKGDASHLEEDIHEALDKIKDAVKIIEGPLMDGMNKVGELFGSGKMFLPQVVKTARTMKQATNILQPYIEQGKSAKPSSNGKVLVATVKGDVHDIGKNIVAVVMACNGYEVIDLGVMVQTEDIVRTAIEENVDLIGLSGLITPSLDEMVNVAASLEKAGVRIPLMIGGATTSKKHTALKIAPVYSGPVIWVKDASQNPIVANRILSVETRDAFIEQLNAEYETMREEHKNKKAPSQLSLEEARSKKPNLF